MSEEPEHKPHATAWTVTLLLLPLLYVLSIGPAVYLNKKDMLSPDLEARMSTFYKPLAWLTNNIPIQKPLDAYMQWWIDLARKL